MERTITTSMVHEQPAWWMAREIEFCHNDGDIVPDEPGSVALCCHICEERLVELALRKEFVLLRDTLIALTKEG